MVLTAFTIKNINSQKKVSNYLVFKYGGVITFMQKGLDIKTVIREKQKQDILFLNRYVFSEEYQPKEIKFRDKQLLEIITFFKNPTTNIDIEGPSGTGKTLMIKLVAGEINDVCSQTRLAVYLNCKHKTETKILVELARILSNSLDVSHYNCMELIERHKADREKTIIILDEVDYLIEHYGSDLLYLIANWGLPVVNITNRIEWRSMIKDGRVHGRMLPNSLSIGHYTFDDAKEIVQDRLREGVKPGVFPEELLDYVIDYVNDECRGDMRVIIQIIRQSVERAEKEGCPIVGRHHVDEVNMRVKNETNGMEFYEGLLPTRQGLIVAAYDFWKAKKTYPLAENIHAAYIELSKGSKIFKPLTLESIKNYLIELTTYHILEIVELNAEQCKARRGMRGKKPSAYKVNLPESLFEEKIYNPLKRTKVKP